MDKALKEEGKIMVICGAGLERSPLIVFTYLLRRCGISIEDALHIVKTKRSQSDIYIEWLEGWLNITHGEIFRFRNIGYISS